MKFVSAIALTFACTVGIAGAQSIPAGTTGVTAGEKAVVTYFVEDSVGDVQIARLALSKSTNAAVRALASNMVRDHTITAHAGMRVASNLGSAVEFKAGDDNQITLSHLSRYAGSAFDREFVHEMIEAHKSDITLAKNALEFAKTPQLRTYLHESITVDTRHLNLAQTAQARVGGGSE